MAFYVKELMVTLEPSRIACGDWTAKPPCSCVLPSAKIACGNTEAQCPTASALGLAAPDSRQNLELLRREIAARIEH